jgi:hypothetical protein
VTSRIPRSLQPLLYSGLNHGPIGQHDHEEKLARLPLIVIENETCQNGISCWRNSRFQSAAAFKGAIALSKR